MDFGGAGVAGAAHQGGAAANVDLMSWYMRIPPVSRFYLTSAFLTTAACAVEIVSPFTLYFNYDLVLQGQFWRCITSFLFFGVFSVDFLFHMYFLVRTREFCFCNPMKRNVSHHIIILYLLLLL